MGLGETIGYGTRLTMNNDGLYQTWSNTFPRAIYIALLGDPTLRMEPVAPISNLSASTAANAVSLSWSASPDHIAGYHVYRAATPSGPFTRISDSLVTGTRFKDTHPAGGTYMVRAIALQTNPSGSYFNPSQGVFVTVGGGNQGTNGESIVVETIGSGTVSPNYNGKTLRVGKTYTMTAKPANGFQFVKWTGSISSDSAKIKFVMAPGMMLRATFEDVKRPALVINYPAAKRVVTNSIITATGRASDNGALAAVYYNFNATGWMPAVGAANWTAPGLACVEGQNTIQAYAVDTAGNVSRTNSIKFNRK
jgi:hypothetical protein